MRFETELVAMDKQIDVLTERLGKQLENERGDVAVLALGNLILAVAVGYRTIQDAADLRRVLRSTGEALIETSRGDAKDADMRARALINEARRLAKVN